MKVGYKVSRNGNDWVAVELIDGSPSGFKQPFDDDKTAVGACEIRFNDQFPNGPRLIWTKWEAEIRDGVAHL